MRGRLPGEEARTNVTFSLTDDTHAKVSLLVHDPVAGRARYGMKSKLAEELFKRFFLAVVNKEDHINIKDLRLEIHS